MTRLLTTLSLLLLPACAVNKIDAILAMYDTFGESSSGESSTTGDPDTTSTDPFEQTTSDPASTSTTSEDDTASTTDPDDTLATDTTAAESTGAPAPLCGDGVKEGDEECDDANDIEGDGCLSNCAREWYVFVTSKPSNNGDIKGLTGTDYECRHRATKMFLPNGERYKAWISTSTQQPVDRLYHARGPYKLVNGLRVAADWDALVAGPLENPINVTEMSESNHVLVFTGTQPDGTRAPNSTHCDDWTDNDGFNLAWFGDSDSTNQDWTFAIESGCAGGSALYCFEQP